MHEPEEDIRMPMYMYIMKKTTHIREHTHLAWLAHPIPVIKLHRKSNYNQKAYYWPSDRPQGFVVRGAGLLIYHATVKQYCSYTEYEYILETIQNLSSYL